MPSKKAAVVDIPNKTNYLGFSKWNLEESLIFKIIIIYINF